MFAVSNCSKYINRTAFVAFLAIVSATMLVACGGKAEPTIQVTTPALEFTLSALQVENARLLTQVAQLEMTLQAPPSSTPTLRPPTETPTLTPTVSALITVAAPQNTITATHAAAPGYVFYIDPEEWTVDNLAAISPRFLVHQDLTDCRIDIVPAQTEETPTRLYPQIIGRRSWLVSEYPNRRRYAQLDLGVEMRGFDNEACRAYQQIVLEDVLTTQEAVGGLVVSPLLTPTPRPAISGFTCPGSLPVRLRPGDRALLTAEFLWLRKEPRQLSATEVRLFPQYAPVQIEVTSGPTCFPPYVYWEVRISGFTADSEVFTGWMAESDGADYFLDVWWLGW